MMFRLSDFIPRIASPAPSPSSSSSLPRAMVDGGYISWSELPRDLTSLILHRLGAIEMLETAQKVCRLWRDVCKDPSMWRKIDMRNLRDFVYDCDPWKMWKMCKMCRHAVGRSRGGLVEIDIWYSGTDELLNYIAESSRNLRSLKLAMCSDITDNGFFEAFGKLPLLEELEVSYCKLSAESMEVVGKSCPNLKTLKLNRAAYRFDEYSYEDYPQIGCDDDALAISETMSGLRHLQLFGNRLSNIGLNAILENCPNLEHLDLRHCFYVDLVGDLEKRCFERIKVVRQPKDSTHDYPYDPTVVPRENDYRSYVDRTEYGYEYDLSDVSDNSDYDQYDIILR